MYVCYFFSSVSPFRSNKKIAEHQEYAGSGYPIILNVRLFGNSYRFRGSVQSSVIQLSAQSVLILNFLNLTLPFLKERSISLIYPHFGHLISIFPVVIVTLSKTRHSHRLHLTITFCSNRVISRPSPEISSYNRMDSQDIPAPVIRAVSFVSQEPF